MNPIRLVAALAITLLVGALLAASSALSVPWHGDDESMVRLSFSARPERIERCRALSAEEIAARPVHMQRQVVCEGQFATYDLVVVLDGDTLERSVIHGGGVRRDRALYLLRNYPVAPGARRIRIAVTRREEADQVEQAATATGPSGIGTDPDRAVRELETRRQRVLAALSPRLALDTIVEAARGRVLLITFDGRGHFVLLR